MCSVCAPVVVGVGGVLGVGRGGGLGQECGGKMWEKRLVRAVLSSCGNRRFRRGRLELSHRTPADPHGESRKTGRQEDRETGRQTDRQTDRKTDS